jgi:KaiC/GvpD/RAD55 family RecA-like ATPase
VKRLSQRRRKGTSAGVPLPDFFPLLKANDIRLRRGQVTAVVAQPNGGKSLFAMFAAMKMQVPTLFISADTDEATMRIRAAASLLQTECKEIEEMMQSSGAVIIDAEMEQLDDFLFWSYEPSPNLEYIEQEILAVDEVLGHFPHLIVLDNLMNVAHSSDAEWQEMRATMAALHTLARKTDSCVMVLHHVSENDSRPFLPPPRKAIQGKVSQLPEQILSVAMNPKDGLFKIAAVKNRHGAHDPTGEEHVTLCVDAARMSLYQSQQDMQRAKTMLEYQ